jgi:hypothetical protein
MAGLLIFRRGRVVGQRAGNTGNHADDQESKAELGGDSRLRAELGGQGLVEMPSDRVVPELWQSHQDERWNEPSELDASSRLYRGVDTGKM